jgi:hypothetical protein
MRAKETLAGEKRKQSHGRSISFLESVDMPQTVFLLGKRFLLTIEVMSRLHGTGEHPASRLQSSM